MHTTKEKTKISPINRASLLQTPPLTLSLTNINLAQGKIQMKTKPCLLAGITIFLTLNSTTTPQMSMREHQEKKLYPLIRQTGPNEN